MDLSLNPSHVTSVRVVDGKRAAIVVQFSKDAFGHIQVEAWGPGHPRLFTISVPGQGSPELEHLESAGA